VESTSKARRRQQNRRRSTPDSTRFTAAARPVRRSGRPAWEAAGHAYRSFRNALTATAAECARDQAALRAAAIRAPSKAVAHFWGPAAGGGSIKVPMMRPTPIVAQTAPGHGLMPSASSLPLARSWRAGGHRRHNGHHVLRPGRPEHADPCQETGHCQRPRATLLLPCPNVLRIMKIQGVDAVLPIFFSLEEALAGTG